ncbi:hypothetical protein [Ruminococcus albus]|uniref:Uncharacterized protein n=1 Tax=Ruminococcus albus (strain ATCC 27210 / DSM 20455 / JCM 14654 / NCDO 2250 / 7) TaxID=697329 RepID=E6UCS9_RUMA7|nr:hypothetical protein [Ruminococcus albus]ADU22758.1 hypothetical protein Rumal_2273 [Ruminococcus albus 7 = DSM 20455]ADU24357.1 hypothetical protein Rumal_3934 [Ruminococcus albus 7 = DSM 20455]
MNEKNNINLADSASEELLERKKMQKAALIKMGAMLVLSTIMLIFSSIAWFTNNSENSASGMKVSIKGPEYEISVLTNGNNGVYDDYLDLVHDDTAIIWKMNGTDSNGLEQNIGNYHSITGVEDDGIHPDCRGYVTFYVTPRVSSVDLDFSFELIGYNPVTENNITSMVQLDSTNDADVINYLNGHILLFEDYDLATDTYSGLIKNTTSLSRLLSDKTYTGKDTTIPVNIYWVWVNNFSDLLNTHTVTEHDDVLNEDVEVTYPFCDDSDFLDYIEDNPQYFMKGITTADNVSISDINSNYLYYGGRYNQADNIIGARVRYLLLSMTVSVS